MKFEKTSGEVVLTNDHGDTIRWDVSVFEKTRLSEIADPFKELNGYLAWMPGPKRNKVWECYVEIRRILNDNPPLDPLCNQLSKQVKILFDLITMDDMSYWLNFYGNVKYPTNLVDECDPDDPSPDNTYTVKDYNGLVVLTAVTRAMVVVWGEFMQLTGKSIGPDWKEYLANRLLTSSAVWESEPIKRLERYIISRMSRNTDTDPAILDSLSQDEVPEWLIANVLIKRIAIGDINDVPGQGNIIKSIFNFVSSKLNGMANSFSSGGIRERISEKSDDSEVGGGSILEMFRVKQALTVGDIAMFNEYSKHAGTMATSIDPTVDPALVKTCYNDMRRLSTQPIARAQVVLCQWIVPSVMSPHSIPCLKKTELIRIMAACQALLWHWGQHDLAILISSLGQPIEEADMGLADPRQRVPAELYEKLVQRFPHKQPKENGNDRKSNYAYVAVMALTKEFATSKWIAGAPKALLDTRPLAIDVARRFMLPANLAEQLTRLVIKIDELRGQQP